MREATPRQLAEIKMSPDFLYVVPQQININSSNRKAVLYFRSREVRENMRVTIKSGDQVLLSKRLSLIHISLNTVVLSMTKEPVSYTHLPVVAPG